MSKHLLYCKDLLNRTLTRSLLFVLPQLVACLIVLIQAISPAEAAGPLSVKTNQPTLFLRFERKPRLPDGVISERIQFAKRFMGLRFISRFSSATKAELHPSVGLGAITVDLR